jgi:outer membrane protein assembly factor BamB
MLRHHKQSSFLPLATVLISLSLSGCSTLTGLKDSAQDLVSSVLGTGNNSEPPAELVEYKPDLTIDVLWKEDVGVGKDNQNLKLDLAFSSDKIFVADREGLVQARTSVDGKLLWEIDTEQLFSAGPGIGANTLILGSSDAKVTALDSSTGEQLWSSSVSSEVLAVPVVANGVVIVRTADGTVIALDEKTGKQLWSFEESLPPLTLRGVGKPLILKDRVIAGFANGKLVALQLENGKSLWETTVAMPSGRSEVERLVDLAADPLEKDGMLFISSYHGGTSAVMAADGNMMWRNDQLSSASGLTADWRHLYISDINSDVWQIDPRNGATLWKQQELHYRALSAPLAYQEYVVVGDYEGYLHWLSSSDGRQLGRVQISKSAIDSTPVVANDIIYIYAKDGTLAALKAKAL